MEAVLDDRLDHGVVRDVRETHVRTVPLQHLIEALEADCQHAHNDHFVERSGFAEVRCRKHAVVGVLLAGAHPVHLVRLGDLAQHLRGVGHAARNQVGITAVASADQRILRAVEDGATAAHVEVLACGQSFGTLGHQSSVVPVHLDLGHGHFGHVVAGREYELHALGRRGRLVQEQRRTALHLGGIAQLQSFEHGMENVAGHVAQRPGSEIPPSAEVPGGVGRIVRTPGSRTDEGVPVHRLGNAHVLFGTGESLGPDGTVGEGVHTAHLADLTVPDPFADLADALARGALVAHLGGYLVLGGEFGEQPGLVDGMGQGLFDVNVLAGGDCFGGDDGVRVVGRGYHHGIGRFEQLLVHLAVVVILLGRGITLENVVGIFPVHVAQSDDILALEAFQHRGAASADADAQDIEFVAGCRCMSEILSQDRARHDRQPEGRCGSCFQERSSRHFVCHRFGGLSWFVVVVI